MKEVIISPCKLEEIETALQLAVPAVPVALWLHNSSLSTTALFLLRSVANVHLQNGVMGVINSIIIHYN